MPFREDANRHVRHLRRWPPFVHPPTG
jgi:hypothetical protein